MGEAATESHFRLVTLGGTAVGKSSILKRFIFGNFCDRHRPTVEDLYSREYDIGSTALKVTFLDTAGDMQFPAMRRLSIANGQAFMLVYSVDSDDSFQTVKHCLEEIREQKTDFQDIPIMVVGNKCDVSDEKRQVKREDVNEWLFCDLPRMRAKSLECSAKENINIREVFKAFLQLAKITVTPDPLTLRRRSSAHVAVGRSSRFNSSLSPQRENAQVSDTGATSQNHQQQEQQQQQQQKQGQQQQQASQKSTSKPRSKSLIRRTSKKVVTKFRDATSTNPTAPQNGENDCVVS